jgi:isoquinoline 1-oxidoreductase beta subunit
VVTRIGNDDAPQSGQKTRREFLSIGLSAAGGLLIGLSLPANAKPSTSRLAYGSSSLRSAEVNAWVAIEPNDTVVLRVAKAEMGQGVLTALPMIIAEELECDWSKVKVEFASLDRQIREHAVYGSMGTYGSSSVSSSWQYLQQAGALARECLIAAACAHWSVSRGDCRASMGEVIHVKTGRALRYGALANDAAKIKLSAIPAIKQPAEFRLIGTPQKRIDTPVKINGQAKFGIDTRIPNMLYAAVTACPVFGGTLKSFDAHEVLQRRGVKYVIPVDTGIAVIADNFWRAKEALAVLPIEWSYGAALNANSVQFADDYRAALMTPGVRAQSDGDSAPAMASARVMEAVYEVPYLAHAPMEPLNCTVRPGLNQMEIWIGTQDPEESVALAAKLSGLKPEQITLHTCFIGGGFGRRDVNDELAQAVAIAKAIERPVKLVWTREEDMRQDRYRPQAAVYARGGLDENGALIALECRAAVGSIDRSLGYSKVESGLEPAAVAALMNPIYRIPNISVECILKNTHVPVSHWRSVGCSQNVYVLESFIDELAAKAKRDPLSFRRELLAHNPDAVRVLDVLAERSGWGSSVSSHHGKGMAIYAAKGGITGHVAEIEITAGALRVLRIVAVVDCGQVVNPRIVESQTEGAIAFGLSAALFGEITISEGRVNEGNFNQYRVVRLAEMPAVETVILPTSAPRRGGVGELGVPPVAPAVCNAIYAACGLRIRSLPIKNTDFSKV